MSNYEYPSDQVYNNSVTITKFTKPINVSTAKIGTPVQMIVPGHKIAFENGISQDKILQKYTPQKGVITQITPVNKQSNRGFNHFIRIKTTGGSRKTRRKCSRKRLKSSRRH
jgi:hypothetical protein